MPWSRDWPLDACRSCDSPERPHACYGFCMRCYETLCYHEKIDEEHAKRKIRRIETNDYEKRRPKVPAWLADHVEETKIYKREYARKQSPWQIGLSVWFWYDARDWIKAKAFRNPKGQMQSVKPPSAPEWAKGKIAGRGDGGKSVIVTSYGRGRLTFGVRRLRLLSFDPKPPIVDKRVRVKTALGFARIVRAYRLDTVLVADVELEKTGNVVLALRLEVKPSKRASQAPRQERSA